MEKKTVIILLVLASIAFLLRWYLMPSHLFFGPEQGRDFLVIRDIVVNHKLTLIGPKTDIDGIFHGPAYYYLAAIPFAVSQGNPVGVLAFFTAIQCVGVFFAYQLALELSKKKRAGYIAAAIYATSYLLIVYSRWLSNPPLSVPLSLAFILFILRFARGKQSYLIAAAIVYGLLGQVEFINFLVFGVIGATTLLIYRKRVFKTKLFVLVVATITGFVTSFLTYVLFDLRHNFLISNTFLNYFRGKGGYGLYPLATSTAGAFGVFMEQAAQIMGLSHWMATSVLVAFFMFVLYKRLKLEVSFIILTLWIWLPPVIFAMLRHGMLDQLYAGVVSGFVILIAISIDWLWEKKTVIGIAMLLIVTGLNVFTLFRNLPSNTRVFFQPHQKEVRYTDQLAVLDWIYEHAEGKPFSFQAFTIPFFFQDAWLYLLQYYAQPKYGYQPDNQGRKLIYIVIQKDPYDPFNSLFRKNWHTSITEEWKTLKNHEEIGDYIVEEWIL